MEAMNEQSDNIPQTQSTETKQLFHFYLLAFILSWALWIPQALSDRGIFEIPATILSLSKFGAYGPLVAALILTFRIEGKRGVKELLARAVQFKLGFKWYLIAFLTFPIILGGSLVLSGVPLAQIVTETNPAILFVGFFVVFFTTGSIQEELGWRGYALDRLQNKMNALMSSIVVGFFWGLWHLPLFFMIREDSYYNNPIWGLMISTILISILFTWIYNNTGRSIFGALLFHAMWNFSNWIFPTIDHEIAGLYMFGLMLIMIITVLSIYGPKKLARVSE